MQRKFFVIDCRHGELPLPDVSLGAGRLRDVRGRALTAEQMEIARLKAELSRVRMERD